MGPPTAGSVFAGYRIEHTAGRGGMGVVYRARQSRPDRLVALKVIAPDYLQDADSRRRFEDESQVAASIEHPNVIPVYEVGEFEGALYIAMRFVEGDDFRGLIRRGIGPKRSVEIVDQIGGALDAAHAHGLVHRDVKPGNVLVSETGGRTHAYLTDFGLAKRVEGSSELTQSGAVVGTPDYMAPEQIEGQRVDARADVYALACVLYHAVTGQVPFPRDSQYATLFAHLNEPTPSVLNVETYLPSGLEEVVQRGMAKDPSARYPSAGDLGRAAVAAFQDRPVSRPERTVAVGEAAPDGAAPRTRKAADTHITRELTAPSRRRGLVAGAAALALGIAAVLVVLIVSGDSDKRKSPPAKRVGAVVGPPIPVPRNPTAIASGAGSVWVTSARTDAVTRIDSVSGRVKGKPIPVGREPAGVTVGNDSVWVANARDDTVVRLDARSGQRRGAPIKVGDQPLDVAVGHGAAWTANYRAGTVSRIDLATSKVKTIRVGAGPVDVVAGEGAVWTANSVDDTLSRINPASNRVLGAGIPVGQAPDSLATAAGGVWVGNIDADQVRKVDAGSNQVVGKPIEVGERPDDVVRWNGGIYVANQDANTIMRIDTSSRRVVGAALSVGNEPIALAADGRDLWVLNFGAESVTRVRP